MNTTRGRNIFRFKSFSDRLNEIDVRQAALYHIGHEYEEYSDDISDTYFHQALKKWSLLNLTDEFIQFYKKYSDIITLPQLVHRKEFVINSLLNKISINTSTISLQPFLELLYVLAKDLREDYFHYIHKILHKLIELLISYTKLQLHDSDIADCIEWIFICLAYLFKTLKTYLKRNLQLIFKLILPIFNEKHLSEQIRNFGIECFAFVSRDLKDYQKLFDIIEDQIRNDENSNRNFLISTFSHLLFEIVHGINGKFHKVAENLLKNLFKTILQIHRDHNLWYEILIITIDCILNSIQPHNIDLLWKIISLEIDTCLLMLSHENNNEIHLRALNHLICLILKISKWKNGNFLCKSGFVIEILLKIIDHTNDSETLSNLTRLICQVLFLENTKITHLETNRLIRKFVLKILQCNVIIFREFIQNICTHSQFEVIYLPDVVKYFELYFNDDKINSYDTMKLLVHVILKKSPLHCLQNIDDRSRNLNENKEFSISFKNSQTTLKLFKIIEEFLLNDINLYENKENLYRFIYAVIIIPHINIDVTSIINKMKNCIKEICNQLIMRNDPQNLIILAILIENFMRISSIHHINDKDDIFIWEICQIIIENLKSIENNLILLKILSFIFTQKLKNTENLERRCEKNTIFNLKVKENFHKIENSLSQCLCSSNHYVRLFSTHILYILSKSFEDLSSFANIYELFNNIETTIPTIQTYREQLLYLQKLSPYCESFKNLFTEITFAHLSCKEVKLNCLRFLLGSLYQNFNLLWEPIQKLIKEYFSSQFVELNDFWNIYKLKLDDTAAIIRKEYEILNHFYQTIDSVKNNYDDSTDDDNIFNQFIENDTIKNYTVNHINYRNLLWSGLSNFDTLIEMKNREIVPIFMEFINKEYRKYRKFQDNYILIWDNLSSSVKDLCSHNADEKEENVNSRGSNDNDCSDVEKVFVKSERQYEKSIIITLLVKLNVFKKLVNPKQIHREHELYEFYLELLSNTNIQLQRSALDCIMTYKYKYLMPYKNNLYALLDEKQFKNELLHFEINHEINEEQRKNNQTILQVEHRKNFVPILLRLLYGRMVSKTTKNLNNQKKKKLIMRFLNGCNLDEILWFSRMAFSDYNAILDNCKDIDEIPDEVRKHISFKQIWSPNKLQSTLNLLAALEKQIGILMNYEILLYLLKIKIFIGAICYEVISTNMIDNNEFDVKILTIFKQLRSNCMLNLSNFFDHFKMNFKWTRKQIDCVFKLFIWSDLSSLQNDCIHSPTPLLKLFIVWSRNPRYFSLLLWNKFEKTKIHNENKVERNTNDNIEELTPMKSILNLLSNKKAKLNIHESIMELIERLLMHDNDEIGSIDSDNDIKRITGTDVIKPYISQILQQFHQVIIGPNSKNNNTAGGVKKPSPHVKIDKRTLVILSKLTEINNNASTVCDQLLEILLSVLINTSYLLTDDNTSLQIITTIMNLLKIVESSEKYLRQIAPLFQCTTDIGSRKLLCKLLYEISNKSNTNLKLNNYAEIINELNAWHTRWIEQPDYERRSNALKQVKLLLTENQKNISSNFNLGVLVIYNIFYIMKYDKDKGMRDNASENLRYIIPKLIKENFNQKDIDYLINDVILNFIKKVLRNNNSDNDIVHNEVIQLLGEIARTCNKYHPILADLYLLTDSVDRECDFFDNITHLQTHRHGRALLKFCSMYKRTNETHHNSSISLPASPNINTLTQFILPLATRYLMNEKYSSKHTLIDASIETIGVICQLLPWCHYQAILKFYLDKMIYNRDYQKQLVRLVVIILDSFHFDLSNANTKELRQGEIEILESQQHNDGNADDEDKTTTDKKLVMKENDLDFELNKFDKNEETIEASKTKLNANSNNNEYHQMLSPSLSKQVIYTISKILIPKLNNSLTKQTNYDARHKINRRKVSKEREEEDTLRVPIALAIVKLLQKLPKKILDSNISGVLIKICTFLKSPLKSVRMLTRDVLKKIMLTLNGEYLPILIHQMRSILTRGFEVHVLSVTIYGILEALKSQLHPDDLQKCFIDIVDICLNDIFGEIAEEKEIEKVQSRTPEAKPSSKTYLILYTIAKNIKESCLLDLLVPFKYYLTRRLSKKIVLKIQECFQKIVQGLTENQNLSQENLLIFLYGTISETVPDLILMNSNDTNERNKKLENDNVKKFKKSHDCFLILEEPKSNSGTTRYGVRTNPLMNAHLLIEFGLEMLHILLKRKKLHEIDYKLYLNSLSSILLKCLKSSYIRVSILTLKCLTSIWNAEYHDIDTIKPLMNDIVENIFQILHKYSTFGCTKNDDNYHIVKNSFKSIVSLLKKCPYYKLNKDNFRKLLFYIEQDIYESDRQPIAFALLKAILNKKINLVEIHEVIIDKICELSIKSESDYTRQEAKQTVYIYTVEYLNHKKCNQILNFYTTQLNYSLPSGRITALQFLNSIIMSSLNKKFPKEILNARSDFLFLSLGTRYVNEDNPECRRLIVECIKLILSILDKDYKQNLFSITISLLENDKSSVREMGVSLCSRFLEQEQSEFLPRIQYVLPVLSIRLNLCNSNVIAGRFVKIRNLNNNDNCEDQIKLQQRQRTIDHELIQVQNCILKIFEYCPEILTSLSLISSESKLLSKISLKSNLDEIAYESKNLLAYEHQWIRINSIRILDQILSKLNFDLINSILIKDITLTANLCEHEFIYSNPENDLKSLVLDLCAQLIPNQITDETAELCMKNLLYIANMIKNVPVPANINAFQNEKTDNAKITTATIKKEKMSKINLNWLLRNILTAYYKEVAKAPHSIILRTAIFNWIEAFVMLIDFEKLKIIVHLILQPLIREMSIDDQNIDKLLKNHAIRVSNKLRRLLGEDYYDEIRLKLQKQLFMKKVERRKLIAQEKVLEPIKALKRKASIRERKKLAKKFKVDVNNGKNVPKRKRKSNNDELF